MVISPNDRRTFIVADIGYGDAGKGTLTDAIARKHRVHTVIRFNGGAQALHRVVDPDGRAHVFSQFGSATLVPGVRTHLSRHMVLSPLGMLGEAKALAKIGVTDAIARTTIDERALVIAPFHGAANRLRELARGDAGRHGSVGIGVGETVSDSLNWPADALRAGELRDRAVVRRKLRIVRDRKAEELRGVMRRLEGIADPADLQLFRDPGFLDDYVKAYTAFADVARIVGPDKECEILGAPGVTVFEGSQGALIDECYGFHPYTTWSTTSSKNAHALLDEHRYDGKRETIGAIRAFAVRHGPGPFVTEDAELTKLLPDKANGWHDWQRAFRVGHFDGVATRYALEVDGRVDSLAVTCLDRMSGTPAFKAATAYVMADGSRMDRLPVVRPPDLKHQESLGARLAKARPVLESTSESGVVMEHVRYIERALGKRVSILSFSETANEKFFV